MRIFRKTGRRRGAFVPVHYDESRAGYRAKRRVRHRIVRIVAVLALMGMVASVVLFLINWRVVHVGSAYIRTAAETPKADAIIILGAYVFPDGKVSEMLEDRLNTGLQLFRDGRAPKIIVSGDHGRAGYDEVNAMRQYLQDRGVRREDIFMDHAGFDTYDSLYRARDIFIVKKAILVTQAFHLPRALYVAKRLGLEAVGVKSDGRVYPGLAYNYAREIGSRTKAFLQAGILHSKPKYLGKVIPVSGSGLLTDDGKS